jgi:exocyst complex component 4
VTPSVEPMSAATPFTPSLPQVAPLAPGAALKLPLSRDMALRFQALLRTYELLAELVLCTVRVDVRCRTIFHLDLTMKNVRAVVGVRESGC